MTIVHSGPAQMIIAGPETAPGWFPVPGWILHNTDPANEIYLDITQNVFNAAGSTNFIIPPGATIQLSGHATYWARTGDGVTADLHLVPTASYGAPGGTATPASRSAG